MSDELANTIAEELNRALCGILTADTMDKLTEAVRPHLAPLQAENAALRAERDGLQAELNDAAKKWSVCEHEKRNQRAQLGMENDQLRAQLEQARYEASKARMLIFELQLLG